MILGITQIALLVRDYDESIEFYCKKLGFKVVEDTLLQSDKRWVRLAAPGGYGSQLLLSKAIDETQLSFVGKQAAGRVLLFLQTDNLLSDYQELKSKGVEFTELPRTESYGKVAVFKDLYGNRIDLIELG